MTQHLADVRCCPRARLCGRLDAHSALAASDILRQVRDYTIIDGRWTSTVASIRDAYGNTKASGFAINFFADNAKGARNAYLASPFFTTFDPIRTLTQNGCPVRLLVRLCSITPPKIVRQALADPLVTLRFYTSRSFHAKLYIIDDVAMVGSANLTEAGLMTNREVSVVLRKGRDPAFDELPGMFNMFWDYADTMTTEICMRYEQAYRLIGNAKEDATFQSHLERFVPAAIPPSAKVGSERVSTRRSFIQGLRRKYDEQLIPAFQEVAELFETLGQRRPEFGDADREIELGRFFGWLRIACAPGDDWKATPLLDIAQRKPRIISYLNDWNATDDTAAGDMFQAEHEVATIKRLRTAFSSPEAIDKLSYDELFDCLIGVHAFYDRLRFVSGGISGLRVDFAQRNTLTAIKDTLTYLLHGSGTSLERAYDCIYDEKRRLGGFGEACTMELLGWLDQDRPPINGRTIKALRFLGFDVKD